MENHYEIKDPKIQRARQTYQQANKLLTKISSIEFLFEQIIHYSSGQTSNKGMKERNLEFLILFEIIKAYYKMTKYTISQQQIYISESNQQEEIDDKNRMNSEAFEKFFTEDSFEKYRHLQPSDQLKKITETFDRIKNRQQNNMEFNQEYEQVFSRSHKRVSLLSKLPVPKDLYDIKQQNRKKIDLMIYIGEIIFIFRPLIYCCFLRLLGLNSYYPYLISLTLDLLRLILQRKIKYYQPAQREEFKTRNKEMILNYLLRNPFYSQTFKSKVILPILDSIFGNKFQFIKNFILTIFEMRCSISLVL